MKFYMMSNNKEQWERRIGNCLVICHRILDITKIILQSSIFQYLAALKGVPKKETAEKIDYLLEW